MNTLNHHHDLLWSNHHILLIDSDLRKRFFVFMVLIEALFITVVVESVHVLHQHKGI